MQVPLKMILIVQKNHFVPLQKVTDNDYLNQLSYKNLLLIYIEIIYNKVNPSLKLKIIFT